VPAGQDSVTALNGRKHAGAEDFAALAWLSNDQTHGKIRDMRQNRAGDVMCRALTGHSYLPAFRSTLACGVEWRARKAARRVSA
jgi:hypothetical protein